MHYMILHIKSESRKKIPQDGKLNNFIHHPFLIFSYRHWPKNEETIFVFFCQATVLRFLGTENLPMPCSLRLFCFFSASSCKKKNKGNQNFNWTFGRFLVVEELFHTHMILQKKWQKPISFWGPVRVWLFQGVFPTSLELLQVPGSSTRLASFAFMSCNISCAAHSPCSEVA